MATTSDQSGASTASDQPGAEGNAPDLDAIVQRAVAAALEQTDKRFQGFQSLMDKKLEGISREFKTAGLSPEQQAQLEEETEAEETERMRRELELYRMREQFPRGADRLLAIFRSSSLEDQLAILESLEDPKAAAQAAETLEGETPSQGDETPVPEVDRNSPSRPLKQGARSAVASGEMNDEIANAILGIDG